MMTTLILAYLSTSLQGGGQRGQSGSLSRGRGTAPALATSVATEAFYDCTSHYRRTTAMNVAGVLVVLALTSALYAYALERLEKRYEPDLTWVTVVIGNGLIVAALAALAALGELTWTAVVLVLAANVVAGLPIIAWQLWQIYRRMQQRLELATAAAAAASEAPGQQRARHARRVRRRGRQRQARLSGRRPCRN